MYCPLMNPRTYFFFFLIILRKVAVLVLEKSNVSLTIILHIDLIPSGMSFLQMNNKSGSNAGNSGGPAKKNFREDIFLLSLSCS